MTKRTIAQYIILIVIVVSGLFLRKNYPFLGGIQTGAGGILLVTVFVGQRIVKKASDRLDKRMRDIILEKE